MADIAETYLVLKTAIHFSIATVERELEETKKTLEDLKENPRTLEIYAFHLGEKTALERELELLKRWDR